MHKHETMSYNIINQVPWLRSGLSGLVPCPYRGLSLTMRFASIAHLLHQLLKKKLLSASSECQSLFEKLKYLLTRAPLWLTFTLVLC